MYPNRENFVKVCSVKRTGEMRYTKIARKVIAAPRRLRVRLTFTDL